MITRKKTIAVLLCILLMFSLVACNKTSTEEETVTTKKQTSKKADSTKKENADDTNKEANAAEEDAVEELTLPITDKNIELEIYSKFDAGARQYQQSLADNPLVKEIMKETGIKLSFIHPPVGPDIAEHFNITIASGVYPDIFRSENYFKDNYPGGVDGAINDGVLINMNELIKKYAPTFLDITESKNVHKDIATDEGTIVKFGTTFAPPFLENKQFMGIIIREDYLKKVGKEVPTNLDEFLDVLRAFKEIGVEIPFAAPKHDSWGWPQNNIIAEGFGVTHTDFILEDGVVKYGPIMPAYKNYLEYLKVLYDEKLMDNDFGTNTYYDTEKMVIDGTGGATIIHIAYSKKMMQLGTEENPDFNLAPVPFFGFNGEPSHLVDMTTGIGLNSMLVSSTCKHPVEAIKLIEYLYQNDVIQRNAWGLGNEEYPTFEVVDGKRQFTDFMMNKANPEGVDLPTARSLYTCGPLQMMWEEEMEKQQYGHDTAMTCFDVWSKGTNRRALIPRAVSKSADESKEFVKIMAEIETYTGEQFYKYVMGTESLDTFEDYVNTVENLNIKRAIEINQQAYDRYQMR